MSRTLPAAGAGLEFFKALEEGMGAQKRYSAYERIVLQREQPPTVVYVTRHLALAIRMADIESVDISRRTILNDLDDIAARAFGKALKERKEGDPGGGDFFFVAAFWLSKAAGRNLETFLQKQKNQRIAVKFNAHLLNVVKVHGSVGSSGFSVELLNKDKHQLERVFAPIQGRVTWKED
jgi:hypothetical protein